jgi:hypothetical protein
MVKLQLNAENALSNVIVTVQGCEVMNQNRTSVRLNGKIPFFFRSSNTFYLSRRVSLGRSYLAPVCHHQ